jgi:hypothetical protein
LIAQILGHEPLIPSGFKSARTTLSPFPKRLM